MEDVVASNACKGIVSTGELRRQLDRQLLTDADLDAFCLDTFPMVYRSFSAGMERQQKLNLLLARFPPEDILQSLCKLSASNIPRGSGSSRHAGPAVRRSLNLQMQCHLLCMVLGLLSIIFGSWQVIRSAIRAAIRTEPIVENSIASRPRTARPAYLTSQPPGALIVDVATGRVIGETPWRLSDGERLSPPRQVCLRKGGFLPQLLTFPPSTTMEQSLHIRLRVETGEATSSSQEETCYDTTPFVD